MRIIRLTGICWLVSSCQALSTCNPGSGHPGSRWGVLSDILINPTARRPRGHQRDTRLGLPTARCGVQTSQRRGSPALPDSFAPHAGHPPGLGDCAPQGAALLTSFGRPHGGTALATSRGVLAVQSRCLRGLTPQLGDDQGPCSGVGSSPSMGYRRWHTGMERFKGVQEAEADFSPRGVSLFRFSLFPVLCSPYHPLSGC